MQEVWKPVVGFEGLYEVSNLGNVRSLPRRWINGLGKILSHNGFLLKQTKSTGGYYVVRFCRDGKYRQLKVHQLVAQSFLGYIRNGKHDIVVDHINGDRQNNHLDNLQLISQRENLSKAFKSNTGITGVTEVKGRYRAIIWVNRKSCYLGTFKTIDEAKNAYISKLNEINKNK